PSGAGPGLAPKRDARRQAAEAGGGGTALPAPAGRGGAPLGRPAVVAAPGRALSTPDADTPAPEAKNPGSITYPAAAADGAPACPFCGGRLALGRSLDPRVSHPIGGAGANGTALDPPDMSARVSGAMGPAHASHPYRAAALARVPGRGDDCAGD